MRIETLMAGLRWGFWTVCYVTAATFALVLLVGMTPAPAWLRWGMFAVIVWALAEDARQKIRGRVAA